MSSSCDPTTNQGNTLHILFGFGGTGGKTIVELANIATHDPVAAELIRERVHIILADTDAGDLRKSCRDVKEAFMQRVPGGPPPISILQLGLGSDIFQDLVQERYEAAQKSGRDGNGLRVLREHWWFDAEGQPFSAHRMPMAINAGAAQCPMVSHFLAWDGMRNMERVLEEVSIHAKNVRRMEEFSVELYLVTSLAGGTGRGCWQLLSLKAREFFGKNNQACRPTGFFMDSSVFGEIMKNRPDQRVKLEVNSLTGLSELAMWLRETKEPEKKFVLPNLADPGDERVASLSTENFMPEADRARRGRSPVHKAYVFTSQSDSLFLDRAQDVYKACAAALYGRLSLTAARSSDANSPARAAVTATSVLYVPVSDIRQTIKTCAKGARARQFLEGRTEVMEGGQKTLVPTAKMRIVEASGDTAESKAYDITPKTQAQVAADQLFEWVKNTFCDYGGTSDQFTGRQQNGTYEEGSPKPIIEYLVDFTAADKESQGRAIAENLKKIAQGGAKDLDAAFKTSVEGFCRGGNPEEISGRFWRSALQAVGGKPRDADGEEKMKEAFFKAFRQALFFKGIPGHSSAVPYSLSNLGGANPEYGSPFMLAAVLARLKGMLSQQLEGCRNSRSEAEPKKKQGTPTKDDGVSTILNLLKKSRRVWAKIPLLKSLISPFSHADLNVIKKKIFEAYSKAVYVRTMQEFRELMEFIQSEVAQAESRIDKFVDAVVRLETAYQKQGKELRDQCFTEFGGKEETVAGRMEKIVKMLRTLEEENKNPVARVVRKLRPIFSAADFNNAVAKAIGRQGNQPTDESFWLAKLLAGPKDGQDKPGAGEPAHLFAGALQGVSDISRFDKSVTDGLKQILEGQSMQDGAMLEVFAIVEVLEKFVAAWIDAYLSTGSEDLRVRISAAVREAVGLCIRTLENAQTEAAKKEGGKSTGNIAMPDAVDILVNSCLNMAEKCDPLIRFGKDRRGGDTVTVFIPKVNERMGDEVSTRIRLAAHARKETLEHVQIDTKTKNPYMLVVTSDTPKPDFDQATWDGWESFSYWRNDPKVKGWLQKAETLTGDSVFCHDDDSVGQGYLSPQYVRNPYFANRRWKPWLDGRQSDQKWRALAYALIGNDLFRTDNQEKPSEKTHKWWPIYQRFKQVVSGLVLSVNYPAERLTLPLLLEKPGDSDGPRFQRTLLVDDNGQLRCAGLNLGEDAYKFSTRRFIEWFQSPMNAEGGQSSDTVFAGIWKEYEALCDFLCHPQRVPNAEQADLIHEIRSPECLQAVNSFLKEYVREWRAYVEKSRGREDDKAQLKDFLEEFDKVVSKADFDVLGLLKVQNMGGR
jgi:hypothetical protein